MIGQPPQTLEPATQGSYANTGHSQNSIEMTSASNLVDELKTLVTAHAQDGDPAAHALVLQCIQQLTLAVEKPTETLRRITSQVNFF